MRIRHFHTISMFALMAISAPAVAQSAADLSADIQAALKQNDVTAALASADALYALHVEQNNMGEAGKTAFSRAKILTAMNKPYEAGKAFGLCDEHYAAINGAAQSLNCRYESALAFMDAGKSGAGIDALKSTEKSLESIGQGQSGLAARVYLSLAEEVLPAKLKSGRPALKKRRSSVAYADKSMAALAALGQTKSQNYTSALFIKAKALEDAKEYQEAAVAYEQAIELYVQLPGASADDLKNAKSRLAIVKSMGSNDKPDNTLTVKDKDGNEVVLEFVKKKSIRFPRVDRKKLIDGARARAEITLNADGSVATVQIIESMPEKDFGEELEKGVSKWVFNAPAGVSLDELPPFEYGMTFFVTRRR